MSDKKKDKKGSKDVHEESDKEKYRAAKKVEKVAKMLGYTNDTNPFGDSNLLQPFVWGKKKQKIESVGVNTTSTDRIEVMKEVEKVRKRRHERENELEEIERLRNEEQRLREAASFGDWQKKEEEFHLEQTKVRSKIRIIENREQPIDTIAKNILINEAMKMNSENKDRNKYSELLYRIDVEIHNPLEIIDRLNLDELSQLEVDIDSYLQLEEQKGGQYIDLWKNLLLITKTTKSKRISSTNSNKSTTSRDVGGLHQSIQEEVDQYLLNKTTKELSELRMDIEKKIRENTTTNAEYWSTMLQEIQLQEARNVIVETHTKLLEDQVTALSHLRKLSKEDAVANPQEVSNHSNDAQREKIDYEMEEDENLLTDQDEILLPGKIYWWKDKYRPRKPRYLNRVKVGWDWNKYNQTHYDHDNPPPKVIQGYKFTIFYPDLIDPSITPRYFVEPTDSDEFVIVRFHAGPPYEDVAFKIINKQWDVHRKSGFRCVFDKGVLQLHFNFMRTFYRR